MHTKYPLIALLFVMISCDFSKSISQDLLTGLTTQGDGLSCDDVYISDGEERLNRNTFTYGEKFYLNFNNIEGFEKSEDLTFPGMQLYVISQAGDTVLKNDDLYADYTSGINISPLLLQANITAADPMRSGANYSLIVHIWDKKGNGTYDAKLDFDLVPNDQITLESSDVSYDEIYLFSQERNVTITDNKAKFNENIYLIFEGLNGFQEQDGKVFIGLSIRATDANGEMILNEEDLVDASMEMAEITSQLAPSFIFNDSTIASPITSEIIIWDKKGGKSIKATVELEVN